MLHSDSGVTGDWVRFDKENSALKYIRSRQNLVFTYRNPARMRTGNMPKCNIDM